MTAQFLNIQLISILFQKTFLGRLAKREDTCYHRILGLDFEHNRVMMMCDTMQIVLVSKSLKYQQNVLNVYLFLFFVYKT